MHTLCTTSVDVENAMRVLSEGEYLILDCEGRDLGVKDGALSLLSLGTPHAQSIYLFDVPELCKDSDANSALERLFATIISSEAMIKVVWDGRMDFSELFFGHGVALAGCLDLQLVDIASRMDRGESDDRRARRLARFDFPWMQVSKLQVEDIHVLKGLDGALKEHWVQNVPPKSDVVKVMHTSNNSDFWMRRPLTNELIKYAADDIKRIAALYDHFVTKGYISDTNNQRLLAQSARYVSIWRDAGRPDLLDPTYRFRQCPYLPFGVLDAPDQTSSVGEISSECSACGHVLELRYFPFVSTTRNVQSGRYCGSRKVEKLNTCKICTLILARGEYGKK